jgi:RNA-directed DNA polymerase
MHTKPFIISKHLVYQAWKNVKANAGSHGIDQVSIKEYESNVSNNLYKLWNKMSSGSYFPKPVRQVIIPKKQGGERALSIPTVEDRVAQTVVKLTIEPQIDALFYEDSYGYRPNKSAFDALAVTRQRCWKWDWVLEYDIKGLFDNINHELLMKAVKLHVQEKWILLYIERWLKSPIQQANDNLIERIAGVPQGGVISPILANLFLHYALDSWLTKKAPHVPWCRYSDDGIIHCRTEEEGLYILQQLKGRFKECRIELHSEKTKLIYCKDDLRKGDYHNTSFEFLGYCFRSRSVKLGNRKFCGFNPAISITSRKAINAEIRSWKIIRRTSSTIQDIARQIDPILIGWWNYYGRYYNGEVKRVFSHVNRILVKWLMRKYKKLRGKRARATKKLIELAKGSSHLFKHWQLGVTGVFA